MNKDEAVRQARDAMDEAYNIAIDNCSVPVKTRRIKKDGIADGMYGGIVTQPYQLKYEVDGGDQEGSRFEKMHMAIAQMINNNMNVIHLMKG